MESWIISYKNDELLIDKTFEDLTSYINNTNHSNPNLLECKQLNPLVYWQKEGKDSIQIFLFTKKEARDSKQKYKTKTRLS